jgi:transposase-like protein
MEIITGVERRRRWRLEEKLRIVAETEQPGASFVAVARRHEVSRGLLWNWRRQVRRGDLVPEPMPVFVPVQIMPDPPRALAPPHPAPMPVQPEDTRVEITLPDGTCVRVGADVGLASLRRIMAAVRR